MQAQFQQYCLHVAFLYNKKIFPYFRWTDWCRPTVIQLMMLVIKIKTKGRQRKQTLPGKVSAKLPAQAKYKYRSLLAVCSLPFLQGLSKYTSFIYFYDYFVIHVDDDLTSQPHFSLICGKSFDLLLHGNCRSQFETENDTAPVDSKAPRPSLSDGKISSSLIIHKLMLFRNACSQTKKNCHLPLIYADFFSAV